LEKITTNTDDADAGDDAAQEAVKELGWLTHSPLDCKA
jgi:hypothetical protein